MIVAMASDEDPADQIREPSVAVAPAPPRRAES
jgi:hypothetical protein